MTPRLDPTTTTVLEPTTGRATAAVLMLHGMGTTAATFTPMMRSIQQALPVPTRILLPQAPPAPVTILDGRETTRWFDLRQTDFRVDEDEVGITEASDLVRLLVDEQVRSGIAARRVAVMGFSQGGALAIRASATIDEHLAGLVSLSGWTPLASATRRAAQSKDARTPVFIGHGAGDPVAPLAWARESCRWLDAARYPVTWRTYPVGHGISEDESAEVAAWLAERLTSD